MNDKVALRLKLNAYIGRIRHSLSASQIEMLRQKVDEMDYRFDPVIKTLVSKALDNIRLEDEFHDELSEKKAQLAMAIMRKLGEDAPLEFAILVQIIIDYVVVEQKSRVD